MADPNSLYSVVAQSSATVVAIVGGFVASAVLNLAVRRRGIEDEIADRERELAAERSECEVAWSARETFRAKRLIANWAEEHLEDCERLPEAEKAAEALHAEDIRRAEFVAEWKAFRSDFARVRRLVGEELMKHGPISGSFYSWVEEHETAIVEDDYWLADKLVSRALTIAARSQTEADVPEQAQNTSMFRNVGFDLEWVRPRIDPAFEVEQRQAEREYEASQDAELQRLQDRFDEAERRVGRAVTRLEVLRGRQRQSHALPPDLKWGFTGLAVLALGGILVPLVLMPQTLADYRPEHKVVVIGLFLLGLVWSLGYFAWLALPPRNSPQKPPVHGADLPGKGRGQNEVWAPPTGAWRISRGTDTGHVIRSSRASAILDHP